MSLNEIITDLKPFSDFNEMAENTLNCLKELYPYDIWVILRANIKDDDFIVLSSSSDNNYNIESGHVLNWSESICKRVFEYHEAFIAPDISKLENCIKEAPILKNVNIASYIGVPLRHSNGDFFGAFCALDTQPKTDEIINNKDLFCLIAKSLMTVYQQEQILVDTQRLYEQSTRLSETDHLTGLTNRRGWEKALSVEEQRSKRYGSPCAVAILDMNNLKKINDRYGHESGDKELKKLAKVLSNNIRENDIAARLGGDEFGILIVESDTENTKIFIERLRTSLKENKLDVAVGYCQRDPRKDFKYITRTADKNLYKDKANRNKKEKIKSN